MLESSSRLSRSLQIHQAEADNNSPKSLKHSYSICCTVSWWHSKLLLLVGDAIAYKYMYKVLKTMKVLYCLRNILHFCGLLLLLLCNNNTYLSIQQGWKKIYTLARIYHKSRLIEEARWNKHSNGMEKMD